MTCRRAFRAGVIFAAAWAVSVPQIRRDFKSRLRCGGRSPAFHGAEGDEAIQAGFRLGRTDRLDRAAMRAARSHLGIGSGVPRSLLSAPSSPTRRPGTAARCAGRRGSRRPCLDARLAEFEHQPVIGHLQAPLAFCSTIKIGDAAITQAYAGCQNVLAPSAARGRSTARRSGSAAGRAAGRGRSSSCFCSPPLQRRGLAAGLLGSTGKRWMTASMRRGRSAIRQRDAAELEIVAHASAREKCCAPAARRRCLGRAGRAGLSRDVAALEADRRRCAAPRRPKIALNTVDLPAPFGPIRW